MGELTSGLIQTGVYGLAGLILFVIAIAVMGRMTPFSLRKEIEEDQNIALAIVMGSFLIGMGLIVAAAIRG